MKKHYSKEEKEMWLEDWRQSGKKAWVYAREIGILPQTFVGWTKRKINIQNGLVEIPRKIIPQVETQEMVVERGEIKIHIPLTISSDELRMIISVLGGVA